MALDTSIGDGLPMTFKEINEVRELIHKNLVLGIYNEKKSIVFDNNRNKK
jgi:hypothetical protein